MLHMYDLPLHHRSSYQTPKNDLMVPVQWWRRIYAMNSKSKLKLNWRWDISRWGALSCQIASNNSLKNFRFSSFLILFLEVSLNPFLETRSLDTIGKLIHWGFWWGLSELNSIFHFGVNMAQIWRLSPPIPVHETTKKMIQNQTKHQTVS